MAKPRSSVGEILDLLVAGYDVAFEYSPALRAIEIRVTTSARAPRDEPRKGMLEFVDERVLLDFIDPDQFLAVTLERIKRRLDALVPAQSEKAKDGQAKQG
jgi:hypothetical protein